MRICFLTDELSFKNGWRRYSVNLLKQLIAQGADCCVLLSERAEENILPQIESYKVLPPLFTSRTAKLFSLAKNYCRIRKLMKKSDVIHSLIESYAPIAYLTKRNKPLIITLHGTYAVSPLRKFCLRFLYKNIYRSAKQLVCVSNFTQKEILKRIRLKNTIVINNGVNYDKFQTDYPQNFSEKRDKIIVGVGALVFRKGYHISISAIAEVKKEYPNLRYYIVGSQEDKSYFNQIKEIVQKRNLEKNVVFLEGISDADLVKIYHQADLFLLTPVNVANYKFEGFGQVYLEAGACGKPVIGSVGCGAEDAIKDGYNGFLTAQNDIKGIAEAVKKILGNQDLAKKLGENGQKLAQRLDWKNVFRKYQFIYESFVD